MDAQLTPPAPQTHSRAAAKSAFAAPAFTVHFGLASVAAGMEFTTAACRNPNNTSVIEQKCIALRTDARGTGRRADSRAIATKTTYPTRCGRPRTATRTAPGGRATRAAGRAAALLYGIDPTRCVASRSLITPLNVVPIQRSDLRSLIVASTAEQSASISAFICITRSVRP